MSIIGTTTGIGSLTPGFCHEWLARAYGRLMYFTSATIASTTSTTIRKPTTIPPPIIQPIPSMRII